MKYKCTLCNKEFKQKGHLKYHIGRKFSCINITITDNDVINNNNTFPEIFTKMDHNESLVNHNESLKNHNESLKNHNGSLDNKLDNQLIKDEDNIENNNNLTCEFCDKSFTHKTNLTRHIKLYCKNKKIIDSTNNTIMALLEQNKQIVGELDKLKKSDELNKQQINDLKEENNELKQLTTMSLVSKGKKKIANTANTANINANNINTNNNINASNNINTNNNNTNNIDNSTTNNYILNKTINFGSEDLSIISEDEILASLKTLTGVFTSFITTVHANEKYPAYSNLKILNKRSNYGFMMEEGKFVTKTFAQITDELINTRLPELEQYARDYRDQKKINLREYNVIKKTLDFLKNTYIETEDIDGNIVKGDKNDVKKLKNELGNVINAMYDNRETILSNIDKCAKGSDNKQIKLITNG